VLSLPQIRQRFYESFFAVHILLAITYLGLLFWHAGNVEDSWKYLWATVAVWLASWFARMFWFMRTTNIASRWFVPARANLRLLEPNLVRIEVDIPDGFKYLPGQHSFLRFGAVSPFDSHPFTIASAPPSGDEAPEAGKGKERLLFLTKVHEGFTRKLALHCSMNGGKAKTRVVLDGPYGGLSRPRIESRYDSLLLIAGGSGISACLSWLLYVAAAISPAKMRNATLLWVVRDPQSFLWVCKELQRATNFKGDVRVNINLYVTGEGEASESTGVSTPRLDKITATSSEPRAQEEFSEPRAHEESQNGRPRDEISQDGRSQDEGLRAMSEVTAGRPDLKAVVKEAVIPGKKLMIISCGPRGMNHDVANICSDAQYMVLGGVAKEVALHVETFGW